MLLQILTLFGFISSTFELNLPPLDFYKLNSHGGGGHHESGEEIRPHSLPYQVSFQSEEGLHICSGSILNEDSILTSAGCCRPFTDGQTKVVAGLHDVHSTTGHEQVSYVSKFIMHSEYGRGGNNNDICILKLETPFQLNKYVAKIQLSKRRALNGEQAEMSGWNMPQRRVNGTWIQLLRSSQVTFLGNDTCFKLYGLGDSMMCGESSIHHFCSGDKGSPAICSNGEQCAILSFEVGCYKNNYPGIFTDLHFFHDWINLHLQ